eukprot:6196861-Pleurochrysis_carterae.AAC.4
MSREQPRLAHARHGAGHDRPWDRALASTSRPGCQRRPAETGSARSFMHTDTAQQNRLHHAGQA